MNEEITSQALEALARDMSPSDRVILKGFVKLAAKMRLHDKALRKSVMELDRRIARLEARSPPAASRPVRALGLRKNSRAP